MIVEHSSLTKLVRSYTGKQKPTSPQPPMLRRWDVLAPLPLAHFLLNKSISRTHTKTARNETKDTKCVLSGLK